MRLNVFFAAIMAAAICAAPAGADRIILAPTGTVLGSGDIKAEAAFAASHSDKKLYWLALGLQRFEINGTRLENYGGFAGSGTVDALGVEAAVLPETPVTPGVGIGVWDASGETADGRGYYAAVSKGLPLTKYLPLPIRDISVHAGVGTGGINGLFGGAQVSLPFGLRLSAEYFQKDVNFGLSLKPLPWVQLNGYLLDGKGFYGLQVNSPL